MSFTRGMLYDEDMIDLATFAAGAAIAPVAAPILAAPVVAVSPPSLAKCFFTNSVAPVPSAPATAPSQALRS